MSSGIKKENLTEKEREDILKLFFSKPRVKGEVVDNSDKGIADKLGLDIFQVGNFLIKELNKKWKKRFEL
jgi:hypothetical protein